MARRELIGYRVLVLPVFDGAHGEDEQTQKLRSTRQGGGY